MLACLFTDAAFHLTLLHTDIESTAKKVEEQILIMTAVRKCLLLAISSLIEIDNVPYIIIY